MGGGAGQWGDLSQDLEVGSTSESRELPWYLASELLPATPVDRVRGLETLPFRPAQGPQLEAGQSWGMGET